MHIKKHCQLLILLVLLAITNISAVYASDVPEQISVPILLYHDIQDSGEGDSTISKKVFLSHLDALQKAGYETVTFQRLINYVKYGFSLPEKPILITFDDGYLSNYKIAWPALQLRGMVGTIFVVGSSVGKDTYKDTGVSTLPHFNYWQANEMIASGVMSIQSHTYDLHQYRPLEADGGREGVLPKVGESAEAYRQGAANGSAAGAGQPSAKNWSARAGAGLSLWTVHPGQRSHQLQAGLFRHPNYPGRTGHSAARRPQQSAPVGAVFHR